MSALDTPAVQSQSQKKKIDRKMLRNQMVERSEGNTGNSLSRGAPSTTRPPLRCGSDTGKSLADQAFSGLLWSGCKNKFLQVDAPKNGTTHELASQYGTSAAQ